MLTVVVLTGPTASGKTELALALAERFPVEVVGADSLQVFRRLDIGSAKPSPEERARVPHHMIDVLDPDEAATAAWYSRAAREVIRDIGTRNRVPLVVGGSGFYLRALEHPPLGGPDELETIDSLAELYSELRDKDPEAAARIHANDRYRISRAVAILRRGNKPSELWGKTRAQKPPFAAVWLAVAHPREELYARIDRRMERMFARGLVRETEEVRADVPGAVHRLSRAIGYKQALEHLEGRTTLDEAVREAQRKSRQYAKRQLTWFRAEPRIEWLEPRRAPELAGRRLEEVNSR